MTILTASLRDLKKLPKSTYKVLITRFYPFYIKGIKNLVDEWIPLLAPNEQLLNDYKVELKRTKDVSKAWEISKYDKRFRMHIMRGAESLAELKRIAIISKQLNGKRVVYLICHERDDRFCHRRIVKELMELGLDRGWIK
jgi:uncharacterized protein YeaO (DUF488 family)